MGKLQHDSRSYENLQSPGDLNPSISNSGRLRYFIVLGNSCYLLYSSRQSFATQTYLVILATYSNAPTISRQLVVLRNATYSEILPLIVLIPAISCYLTILSNSRHLQYFSQQLLASWKYLTILSNYNTCPDNHLIEAQYSPNDYERV